MPELRIILEGDGAFADWQDKGLLHGQLTRVAALDGGMTSGKPSVSLGIELDDGRVVIAETSVRLLQMAAAAITGKYGDLTGTKATVTLE